MGAFWEGLSSQSHATGAEPATPPKATANHHHGSPARNSTNAPLIATSIAVPKSGCSITSAVGTAMITPVASTAPTRGGNSCRSRYQDRKSVVQGQSVSVRVDLGGRRIIKNITFIKIF